MNVLQMDDSINEHISREDAEISTEKSVAEAEGKELPNLGADMLGAVFSYLPQKQLFEVLSVSKDWEKAVMEGSGLWNKADVRRKWNLGGKGCDMRGNDILRRVIGFAEDVTFSKAFRGAEKHVMSVGGWLAPNLRILRLPSECVHPTFFLTLVSECPLLESLVVYGTLALGTDPVHIRHSNLKSLIFSGSQPKFLTIDCPTLTHLSTFGERGYTTRWSMTPYAPSFFFPRLKSLHLSRVYCEEGVLEAIAAHAPSITFLDAYLTYASPIAAFTQFKALHALKVWCDGERAFPSNAFTSWPLLESFRLIGNEIAGHIEVAHVGLKSLEISDNCRAVTPILSCSALEHLKLIGGTFQARCLKNLELLCPQLKIVEIGCSEETLFDKWDFDEWDEDEADGPLEMVHERVEELVLVNFTRSSVRVACTNLKKLVMKWGVQERPILRSTLTFPIAECPRLKSLELFGYDNLFRSIPGILSVLPSLESLRCECFHEESKDLVLEHQNIRDIVLVMTEVGVYPVGSEFKLKRLTLIMPSLVRVEVVESIERFLEVASTDNVIVEYTRCVDVTRGHGPVDRVSIEEDVLW